MPCLSPHSQQQRHSDATLQRRRHDAARHEEGQEVKPVQVAMLHHILLPVLTLCLPAGGLSPPPAAQTPPPAGACDR
jgi:hypothetical protein